MPTFKRPSGFKPRLAVTLPSPNGVVVTMKDYIKAALTAAKADLFNNDTVALKAFLTSINTNRVSDGFLEQAPDGTDSFYIMTDFLGRDLSTSGNPIFAYSGAQVKQFGVEITPTTSRHYFGTLNLDDILIYADDASVNIVLDISFS